MKQFTKRLFNCIIAITGLMSLTSCDDVKPDDRYILENDINVKRSVLLEDFTGQKCINCPEAHKVIEELENQYGKDKVVAVSIHCGTYGYPKSRTDFPSNRIGLMADEGNAILETYAISDFPMGVVDMGTPITHDLWATAVRNALQEPSDIKIELEADYRPGDKDNVDGYNGTIDVKARILSGSTRTADVQFWIVEDGIVAMQRSLTGTIDNYTHNNVFRAQIFNGVRGETVSLPAGIELEKSGSIPTRWNSQEHWEISNLSVIAFVSDKSGVLQVTRVPLTIDK